MDKLIFTAVSGAERLMRAQQVHANNLANLDTAGFRASMEVATNQQLGGYGYDDRHLSSMQARSCCRSTPPSKSARTARFPC
jgi:flagellar basal-body rod protein FlgF